MQRLAKREILRRADINATEATHATYFCFFEYTERLAYSAGQCGWTGNLFRGLTSGCLYAVTDGANEDASINRAAAERLGDREKYVIETLDHVEEVEHDGCKYSMVRYFSSDGEHSFSAATFDYGKTWRIVG